MSRELYHWGIKGMKWGVRRYQNSDGSLTPAGKKRYYDTPDLNRQKSEMDTAKAAYKTSKSEYNKAANRYSNVPLPRNYKAMKTAQAKFIEDRVMYRRAKLTYDTNKEAARIEDKGIEFKNKSKHRLRLEEQYKQIGMTDEQAQAAANNRIRTEKILATAAVLTVGACAAYVAVKARKDRIDGVIKAGETLQRIEMQDTGGKLHDVFYVAKDEKDMKRYENLLGFTRQQQTGHAYMMKLQANSDIKVASMDKARKTFQELYDSDSQFRKTVDRSIPGVKGAKARYDRFNQALVNMQGDDTAPATKFYNALKKKGYGAIQDVNDMKFSGYNAKNPLIVFDNSKNSIMVSSMSEIKENLAGKGTKELLKATGETLTKEFVERAGPLSAAALTTATVYTYASNPAVQNYKNQHPNTTLTDRQIAAMLGG